MIKVTSEISTTKENCAAQIKTRVIIGYEKEICNDCKNKILKAELKALIKSIIETRPDLLYDALEEVTKEALCND